MRKLYYIIFLFSMAACVHKAENSSKNKILPISKRDPAFTDDKDSVIIDTEQNFKITKKDLRQVLKECPEFNEEGLSSNDAYALKSNNVDYSCEVCHDDYYRLYAYFVKERNGVKKYQDERARLLKVYRDINYIYGRMLGGGTYYGHQHRRILGYVEYSIYLSKVESDYYLKHYNIAKQKAAYIAGLRQLITDEVNDPNNEFTIIEKPEVKKELFKTVDEINGLITNNFFFKMAQSYQYSNY